MTRLKYFLVLILCFHLDTQAQEIKDDSDQKNIASLMERQKTAWNNGDIDGYMNEYWKSDSLLFTSGGKVQAGWTSTYEKYKKSYDSKEKMGRLIFSDIGIRLLSQESAWIFGRWELLRKNDNPKGVFTLIMKKINNQWKIIHDHTSSQSDK